mgnify:FL=1
MGNLQEIEEEMRKEFRTFTEAKKFVHTLGIKGQRGWTIYCKSGNKPDDIPYHPDRPYKKRKKEK